jgi:hypothetical protein
MQAADSAIIAGTSLDVMDIDVSLTRGVIDASIQCSGVAPGECIVGVAGGFERVGCSGV